MTSPWDISADDATDPRSLERHVVRSDELRRLAAAGGFEPEKLSVQGQRILWWLTGWDDWTTDGLVEILNATRTSTRIADLQQDVARTIELLEDAKVSALAELARRKREAER